MTQGEERSDVDRALMMSLDWDPESTARREAGQDELGVARSTSELTKTRGK